MLNDLLFGSAPLLSSRAIGGALLLTIAAIVIGYVVWMIWPKKHYPGLFAILAAAAFVGTLSFAGSTSATLAIVFLAILGVLFGVLGLLF
jgi:hypothetical protein